MEKSIFSKEHKTLIAKLIRAREESGLSQQNAAKALGHSQSYISKIESGQRRIDIIQIKEFAKLYKKSASFFIS